MNLIFNHIPSAQVSSSYHLPNMLLTPHPQMAHLSTLSPEGVASIAAQLTSGVIFNSQHFLHEPRHPLLIALKDGFDLPLGFAASRSTFSQVPISLCSMVNILTLDINHRHLEMLQTCFLYSLHYFLVDMLPLPSRF
jgi:hypothetical protein